MDFWRLVVLFLVSFNVFSQSIEEIRVSCGPSQECQKLKNQINNLWTLPEESHSFKRKMQFILLDESIENVKYDFIDDTYRKVHVYLTLRKRIKSISVLFNQDVSIDEDTILANIPLKRNYFLDPNQIDQTKNTVKEFLEIRGFVVNNVTIDSESISTEISIKINVHLESQIKIRHIDINIDHAIYKKDALYFFSGLVGQNFNTTDVLSRIQEYIDQVSNEGFFYAQETHSIKRKGNEVVVSIQFNLGERYQFHFFGNEKVSRIHLINLIKQEIKKREKSWTIAEKEQFFVDFYESTHLYGSSIKMRKIKDKTIDGIPIVIFYVDIDEGKKLKVHDIIYNGISSVEKIKIQKKFEEEASSVAARHYLDKRFFNDFALEIKKDYIKNGFIFADVAGPFYERGADHSSLVTYNITKNRQNILTNITIEGVPTELRDEMILLMKNKVHLPVDVLALEEDLTNILNLAKKKGFYFAEMTNLFDRNIIRYSNDFNTSEIYIIFKLGQEIFFGDLLITGNRKTKDRIIRREIRPFKGSWLTLQKIQEIENKLLDMRLFSNVKLTPLVVKIDEKENKAIANILVQVVERPFGSGEFSAGYRNDLGIKTALSMSYSNLWGEHHTIASTIQANRRLHSSDLDPRRQEENKKMLEGFLEFKYTIPYWPYDSLFLTQWEFEMETSFQRKRFYSFDADVLRLGPRISKEFSPYFSSSFRYQFESIHQFDATELRDNDTFKLGGLTPSITLDFRDNDTNPTKGAYFALSWEFANKFFGPQIGNSIDINYYKLISRNRFYYPIKDWIFVVGISAGHQRNFATGSVNDNGRYIVGHIPSIKVFRLGGPDNVRGYSDTEINRLDSGEDISDLRIDDDAYFVNYKFEPRYRLNDHIMVNIFFDAGRIYLHHFKPLSVRMAMGSGIKILTPVGGLDFDYGIKIARKSYENKAIRESFGRFHLTIGQF